MFIHMETTDLSEQLCSAAISDSISSNVKHLLAFELYILYKPCCLKVRWPHPLTSCYETTARTIFTGKRLCTPLILIKSQTAARNQAKAVAPTYLVSSVWHLQACWSRAELAVHIACFYRNCAHSV